ncbi:MAG TPA: hypothetical protein VHK88_19340 [Aquihabitans sp.]|nr:hypothetical protein [Aquihabitans sp.]
MLLATSCAGDADGGNDGGDGAGRGRAGSPPFTGVPALASPTVGTIDVAGDSVTAQAVADPGARDAFPADADVLFDVRQGARIEDHLAPLAQRAQGPMRPRPDLLVVALGTVNGLGPTSGGWDDLDAELFAKLLAVPDGGSCVVVVLPGVGPQASPADRAAAEAMRADMRRLVRSRPHTVVADWGAWAAEHPDDLAADGIALSSAGARPGELAVRRASRAWLDLVERAVGRCADA